MKLHYTSFCTICYVTIYWHRFLSPQVPLGRKVSNHHDTNRVAKPLVRDLRGGDPTVEAFGSFR